MKAMGRKRFSYDVITDIAGVAIVVAATAVAAGVAVVVTSAADVFDCDRKREEKEKK